MHISYARTHITRNPAENECRYWKCGEPSMTLGTSGPHTAAESICDSLEATAFGRLCVCLDIWDADALRWSCLSFFELRRRRLFLSAWLPTPLSMASLVFWGECSGCTGNYNG